MINAEDGAVVLEYCDWFILVPHSSALHQSCSFPKKSLQPLPLSYTNPCHDFYFLCTWNNWAIVGHIAKWHTFRSSLVFPCVSVVTNFIRVHVRTTKIMCEQVIMHGPPVAEIYCSALYYKNLHAVEHSIIPLLTICGEDAGLTPCLVWTWIAMNLAC